LVNCCYNGISAIGQIQYGKMAALPEIQVLMDQIMKEFLAVAHKEGVVMTLEQAAMLIQQIATTMSGQRSSTAQDLARKKPTEIDYLNGLIVKKGQDYGIRTPVNQSIYALVKMLESSY
jgi:2-dehydropantoate 2-reductase